MMGEGVLSFSCVLIPFISKCLSPHGLELEVLQPFSHQGLRYSLLLDLPGLFLLPLRKDFNECFFSCNKHFMEFFLFRFSVSNFK